jgi:hypothetical protein
VFLREQRAAGAQVAEPSDVRTELLQAYAAWLQRRNVTIRTQVLLTSRYGPLRYSGMAHLSGPLDVHQCQVGNWCVEYVVSPLNGWNWLLSGDTQPPSWEGGCGQPGGVQRTPQGCPKSVVRCRSSCPQTGISPPRLRLAQ